jgi:hypothetical protein
VAKYSPLSQISGALISCGPADRWYMSPALLDGTGVGLGTGAAAKFSAVMFDVELSFLHPVKVAAARAAIMIIFLFMFLTFFIVIQSFAANRDKWEK